MRTQSRTLPPHYGTDLIKILKIIMASITIGRYAWWSRNVKNYCEHGCSMMLFVSRCLFSCKYLNHKSSLTKIKYRTFYVSLKRNIKASLQQKPRNQTINKEIQKPITPRLTLKIIYVQNAQNHTIKYNLVTSRIQLFCIQRIGARIGYKRLIRKLGRIDCG